MQYTCSMKHVCSIDWLQVSCDLPHPIESYFDVFASHAGGSIPEQVGQSRLWRKIYDWCGYIICAHPSGAMHPNMILIKVPNEHHYQTESADYSTLFSLMEFLSPERKFRLSRIDYCIDGLPLSYLTCFQVGRHTVRNATLTHYHQGISLTGVAIGSRRMRFVAYNKHVELTKSNKEYLRQFLATNGCTPENPIRYEWRITTEYAKRYGITAYNFLDYRDNATAFLYHAGKCVSTRGRVNTAVHLNPLPATPIPRAPLPYKRKSQIYNAKAAIRLQLHLIWCGETKDFSLIHQLLKIYHLHEYVQRYVSKHYSDFPYIASHFSNPLNSHEIPINTTTTHQIEDNVRNCPTDEQPPF